MKVVVFIDPVAGGMSIFHPAYNDTTRPAGETDDECLARCTAKALPADLTRHIEESDTLPTDRYLRNACEWED